ncbi:High mobility group B protein 15 [Citrus sinensis]|uniref:High mobility group B protein 15 n=1 Tax=Citrus sinensis TaxID=2711 RepID=A0ACB8I132_CITSI|nr:High mobility group B protein 15 [Citrus sinensis]
MASTSCAKQSPVPKKEPASGHQSYPPPLAKYEDIVVCPKLFMATLEKLHAAMSTKFMIPIIGGKELDLHRLFVEVTARGGIEKIIKERRWKEVTAIFNFPSTATNASFVLRKYYQSLLRDYEQIYFFRSQDSWQGPSTNAVSAPGTAQPSPDIQSAVQQPRINAAVLPEARPASSGGSPVIGVIDGKFESGYLVTVTIGSEKLKGVLYQAPQYPIHQVPSSYNVINNNNATAHAVSGVQRRRRRKKSEIKRRDPAHPKPNRSGYNFFFAEQHARLKPLHPGKDREISRMIGELWNKLKESEKATWMCLRFRFIRRKLLKIKKDIE